MHHLDISVIVCTYNRSTMLEDTLRSWSGVVQGDIQAELIVVDNASTDGSGDVVRRFREQCQSVVKYVHEPRIGLSLARNRGVQEARGDIVAFVDDDVYFDPNWLTSVYSTFSMHVDADCLGGRSIPKFDVTEPDWLSDRILRFYGSTQSGEEMRQMTFPEHPFGVNMAFRRRVFDVVGGFRPELGRKGTSLLSDEEKELFYRIANARLKVLYVPDAIIYHRVSAERLDPHWLMRRAYWQGISSVIFDKHIRRRSRLGMLKKLYRNVRSLTVPSDDDHNPSYMHTRLRQYRSLGVIRQSVIELFRLPGLRRNIQ